MTLDPKRRDLLKAIGVSGAAALAGCSEATSYEFVADPVYMPAAAADDLGFREVVRDSLTVERAESVGGVEARVSVESHYAVYESATDGPDQSTTPSGTDEVGQTGNPLLARALSEAGLFVLKPGEDLGDRGGRFVVKPGQDLNELFSVEMKAAKPASYLGPGFWPFLQPTEGGDGPGPVADTEGLVLFVPKPGDGTVETPFDDSIAVMPGDNVVPGGGVAFSRDVVLFSGGDFFGDYEWPLLDGPAPKDSKVAFVPPAGTEVAIEGDLGTVVEAGTELDAASLYVAGRADSFFDTRVSVTDSDQMVTDSDQMVTDPDQMVPRAAADAMERGDAGMIVMFDDDGRGVPFTALPDPTLPSASEPAGAVTPSDVKRQIEGDLVKHHDVLAVPLGTFLPEAAFTGEPSERSDPGICFDTPCCCCCAPGPTLGKDWFALFLTDGSTAAPPGAHLVESPDELDGEHWFALFATQADLPPLPYDGTDGDRPETVRPFYPKRGLAPTYRSVGAEIAPTPATAWPLLDAFPTTALFPDGNFAPASATFLKAKKAFSDDDLGEEVGAKQIVFQASGDGMAGMGPGEAGTTVGALSTPAAKVGGRSTNPLGTMPIDSLFTSSRTEPLLANLGVGNGSVEWQRGPERLRESKATVLGKPAALSTHAGIVGSASDPSVAFVHVARVESGDDVVFAVGADGWSVDDPGRDFVGPDGYVTDADLAARTEETVTAVGALQHGPE